MSIRLSRSISTRLAACALFGFLAAGAAITPSTLHHSVHADSGTTQSTTTPPPPPPSSNPASPNGLIGWD